MLRAFAEDPHAYIPLGPGEDCVANERFVLAMRPGGHVHSNVAVRLRLESSRGDSALIETVNEIRALVTDRLNPKVSWLVGALATPVNLTERLLDLGAVLFAPDPVLGAMVCTRPPAMGPSEVVVKKVTSREEFAFVRAINRAAFNLEHEETEAEIELGFSLQCETSFRAQYLALVHARWVDAVGRGTPALVTHAGRMSRPILERLGFECISEVALLTDA